MCGIVGYNGNQQAAGILLNGLAKLEYRGYDSAGIAVRDERNVVKIIKAKGRLSKLMEKINMVKSLSGTCGIGHTRWATHGEASKNNAHPHKSNDDNVIGVHNGIIENYVKLREKLQKKGYTFYSQTDTEVVIKLIDYYYKKYQVGPQDALARTMAHVKGSYALAVMFRDYPEEIWATRKDSPLIIGVKNGESMIASDVTAVLKHMSNVYYMGNLEMARIGKGEVCFFNMAGERLHKGLTEVKWKEMDVECDGYKHYMIKEIHEQPQAVKDTLDSVLRNGMIDISSIGISNEEICNISGITIVACGSAYHAGIAAQYVIEDLARIPVRVEVASEFRYRTVFLDKDSLVIVISQSGETADSLAALQKAKEMGIKTLGIVNVMGSAIAREADHVFYTLAGPEIAVATTKAYSAQLIVGYLLAIQFAKVRGLLGSWEYQELIGELLALPGKIARILEDKELLLGSVAKHVNSKGMFFIGRGIDYAVCMEGCLKMKELSYIPAEAYAAGELKHGPISLIEEEICVIGVLTQRGVYEKTLSNLAEVECRGASLHKIIMGELCEREAVCHEEFITRIPETSRYFAASLAVIPMQLLAYYMCVEKGLDVDKPRNLAKSVTVE